jgi:hypothetical protein
MVSIRNGNDREGDHDQEGKEDEEKDEEDQEERPGAEKRKGRKGPYKENKGMGEEKDCGEEDEDETAQNYEAENVRPQHGSVRDSRRNAALGTSGDDASDASSDAEHGITGVGHASTTCSLRTLHNRVRLDAGARIEFGSGWRKQIVVCGI